MHKQEQTLALKGIYQAQQVAALSWPVLADQPIFRLDLSGVEAFDSSLLAWILALKEQVMAQKGVLELVAVSAELCHLMALYGLEDLLLEKTK